VCVCVVDAILVLAGALVHISLPMKICVPWEVRRAINVFYYVKPLFVSLFHGVHAPIRSAVLMRQPVAVAMHQSAAVAMHVSHKNIKFPQIGTLCTHTHIHTHMYTHFPAALCCPQCIEGKQASAACGFRCASCWTGGHWVGRLQWASKLPGRHWKPGRPKFPGTLGEGRPSLFDFWSCWF